MGILIPVLYDKIRERGRKEQESSRLYLSNLGNDLNYKLNEYPLMLVCALYS
jgi:hypothetical protein